jgi:predicted nucleic acid-binding protein
LFSNYNRKKEIPVKIYLDVCCLCRPFDNHQETRIRLETEAILAILKRCSFDWELVTSTAVMYEIGLIGDPVRRSHVIRLTHRARETIRVDDILLTRAAEIEETGIIGMDAIHIACAEKAGAIFLTTDDEVVRIMKKHSPDISTRVDNPLRWLMELNHDGE